MARSRHPSKEIEAALRFAELNGWRVEQGGSHAWGQIYCPYNSRDCRCGDFCRISIWSTPRNPENHAKAIRRVVTHCALLDDGYEYVSECREDHAIYLHSQVPAVRRRLRTG